MPCCLSVCWSWCWHCIGRFTLWRQCAWYRNVITHARYCLNYESDIWHLMPDHDKTANIWTNLQRCDKGLVLVRQQQAQPWSATLVLLIGMHETDSVFTWVPVSTSRHALVWVRTHIGSAICSALPAQHKSWRLAANPHDTYLKLKANIATAAVR